MSSQPLTIGEVARRSGVATSTLRYYESIGLLEPAPRVSGQRRYGPEAVATVGVILFFQQIGFTLAEINRLIRSRQTSPTAWRELARHKRDELAERVAREQVAQRAIEHALACPQDDILACPTFWSVVSGVLEGKTVAEAHSH